MSVEINSNFILELHKIETKQCVQITLKLLYFEPFVFLFLFFLQFWFLELHLASCSLANTYCIRFLYFCTSHWQNYIWNYITHIHMNDWLVRFLFLSMNVNDIYYVFYVLYIFCLALSSLISVFFYILLYISLYILKQIMNNRMCIVS